MSTYFYICYIYIVLLYIGNIIIKIIIKRLLFDLFRFLNVVQCLTESISFTVFVFKIALKLIVIIIKSMRELCVFFTVYVSNKQNVKK